LNKFENGRTVAGKNRRAYLPRWRIGSSLAGDGEKRGGKLLLAGKNGLNFVCRKRAVENTNLIKGAYKRVFRKFL
jgi:hypothetical protein